MQNNIPAATLAAGDQSDPAWWLACAEFHEGWAAAAGATEQERANNSAAALACRTFAAMMERAASDTGTGLAAEWEIADDGDATWIMGFPRSLPAAAVAALTEDA
jgi:hypothetical protein